MMLFAVLYAALAIPASSPADIPVLTRLSTSGFSIIGHTETCLIYEDRVEVRRTMWVPNHDDALISETSYPIALTGDVMGYIDAAAKGEQTSEIGPTDVPQLHYHAYHMVDGGHIVPLDLGSRMDAHITHNATREAEGLKMFINAHCPPL